MAEKKQCTTCNGQGGWWETGNSKKNAPPKRWIKCNTCGGSGSVPA